MVTRISIMSYKILYNWQVTEPMSVLILKVHRALCLVFLICVCYFLRVAVCVCASRVHLLLEVGCHVLSDTAYMSVLA